MRYNFVRLFKQAEGLVQQRVLLLLSMFHMMGSATKGGETKCVGVGGQHAAGPHLRLLVNRRVVSKDRGLFARHSTSVLVRSAASCRVLTE